MPEIFVETELHTHRLNPGEQIGVAKVIGAIVVQRLTGQFA